MVKLADILWVHFRVFCGCASWLSMSNGRVAKELSSGFNHLLFVAGPILSQMLLPCCQLAPPILHQQSCQTQQEGCLGSRSIQLFPRICFGCKSEVGGKRVCKDRAPQPGGRFVPSVRACAQCDSCRIRDKMGVRPPSLFPFGRGAVSLFPSGFLS